MSEIYCERKGLGDIVRLMSKNGDVYTIINKDKVRKEISKSDFENNYFKIDEFIKHEALHTTHMINEMIHEHLENHWYFHSEFNPEFNEIIEKVQDLLAEAYQIVSDKEIDL